MLILGPKMAHLPPFWASKIFLKKGFHYFLVLNEPEFISRTLRQSPESNKNNLNGSYFNKYIQRHIRRFNSLLPLYLFLNREFPKRIEISKSPKLIRTTTPIVKKIIL